MEKDQQQELPLEVDGALKVEKARELAAEEVQPARRVSIGQAALITTAAVFIARFLGLLRGSVFTAVIPPGDISDAYTLAFQVPNLVYNIVAGGALASAFIPVFNHYVLKKQDEGQAWRLASVALNLSGLILVLLGLCSMVFARQLTPFYFPSVRDPAQLERIANLMRIMFLQAMVMGVGVVVNAILYARKQFLLPALAQLLYPLGMLIGLLPGLVLVLLHRRDDMFAMYCASWGVVLAAVLMVVVQVPGLPRLGMRYHWTLNWQHPGIGQIVRMMVPRVLNAIMLNFSQWVDVYLIQLLAFAGFQTEYTLAFSIVTIPLGLVMGVATALFPSMTEYVAQGHMERLRAVITGALRNILFISIPISVGMMVLSLPIVQVLYEHNDSFTLTHSELTSIPLICYAVGLAGLAAVEILTRSFYALSNTRLPVTVSICQFVFKIMLSLLLVKPVAWLVGIGWGSLMHLTLSRDVLSAAWGMGALAFATSLATLAEAAVLLWLLHRRIGGLQLRALLAFVKRVLLATLAMSLVIMLARVPLDLLLVTSGRNGNESLNLAGIIAVLVKLVLLSLLGAVVYLKCSRFLKLLDSGELAPVQRLLARLHLAWL
ncbi:MAG: murein biosynthesis integral membrane protein MurJ [Ktedonobacteraceae bacterium]|nr:murein biosynthesis integral membrane protein MurJ [Ktedonobacteraceae bacterium]